MSKKKTLYFAIGLFGIFLLAFFALLFRLSSDNKTDNTVGLRNTELPTTTNTPVEEIKEENDKQAFTSESVYKFEEHVISYLSEGKFSELDSWLSGLSAKYDNQLPDEDIQDGIGYREAIDTIRADISLLMTHEPSDTLSLTRFKTREVLAAAIVYAPISLKLDAIINQDSLVLPGVLSDDTKTVLLHEVNKNIDEKVKLLNSINSKRTNTSKYMDIAIYGFTAYGRDYQVTIVQQQNTLYAPYFIEQIDGTKSEMPTVSVIKQTRDAALAEGREYDVDAFMTGMSEDEADYQAQLEGRTVYVDVTIPPDYTPAPDIDYQTAP